MGTYRVYKVYRYEGHNFIYYNDRDSYNPMLWDDLQQKH